MTQLPPSPLATQETDDWGDSAENPLPKGAGQSEPMDTPFNPANPSTPQGNQRLVRRVVTPALRWWLQTQLEAVAHLDIDLQAQDKQLFSGYLPLVRVIAAGVIYQGLCLSQAKLQAENIRVNLGQILRGKPLKLMEPIQAWGELHLSQTDLQQSLDSDLMRGALRDLLGILSQELNTPLPRDLSQITVKQAEVNFGHGELDCALNLVGESEFTVEFSSELGLAGPQLLEFRELRGLGHTPQTLQINLGDGVHLENLEITPEKLICQGGMVILP